jgi:hypothetical protein
VNQEMLNTVSCCYEQLDILLKLKDQIYPDTWADCLRLIDRCEIFRDFVKDLLNSPDMLEEMEEKEERCLNDLEKTLLDAEAFVKEFVSRNSFIGITESSYRQGCSTDFSKIVRSLFRLAADLNVGSNEIDYDRVRVEDLEVSHISCSSCSFLDFFLQDQRKTFKYSFKKVLEEIELSPVFREKYLINAKKDLESYSYVISKFLALNKHMALTVSETKVLKADVDGMRNNLEKNFPKEKDQHIATLGSRSRELTPKTSSESLLDDGNTSVGDSSRPSSFNSASSLTSSLSSKSSTVGGAVSSVGSRGSAGSLPNHGNQFDMDRSLASRLIHNEPLSSEQAAKRMKMLSSLRLQQEDVLVSSIKIGQGGFGDVVLGNYKRKYKCAIKTIRNVDDLFSDNKRKTIENELLIMKYVGSHRTLLPCYGFIMEENAMMMHVVLELSPYGSLDNLLKETTLHQFPLSLVIAWLIDLSDALAFLHSREIKCRDLKAENMLLFDRLAVKLCDFGTAKHHLSTVTADDNSGIICFTAPEVRVGQVSDTAR